MLISHVVSESANVYDNEEIITGCCINKSPSVIRIHGDFIAMVLTPYSGVVYPASALSFLQIGFTSSRDVGYTVKFNEISRV